MVITSRFCRWRMTIIILTGGGGTTVSEAMKRRSWGREIVVFVI